MKIAMLGEKRSRFDSVFTPEILKTLGEYGELSPRISSKNLEENKEFLKEAEVAFSTWGTPRLTKAQIKARFPKLKVVFYAAGTVQYFAKPFLESGVRITSAAAANAVPVAEFVFAQISLAAKGYFRASRLYKLSPVASWVFSRSSPGNYKIRVGLAGLGTIGSMVAEKLKALDVEVCAYDPFVSREKARALNVEIVDLETLFRECDVVSNHLANKPELKNLFGKKLFGLMKKRSVFINTGRGAQVNERELAASLLSRPSKTALLDVLKNETFPYLSPLFWTPNAFISPHLAGSAGNEPQRMARYMIDELKRYLENGELLYETKLEDLETTA